MSVTNEDIRMLSYFWTQKGDITRSVDLHNRMPALMACDQTRRVVEAFQRFKDAEKIMDLLVADLVEPDDE